jgi:hypothetical protein
MNLKQHCWCEVAINAGTEQYDKWKLAVTTYMEPVVICKATTRILETFELRSGTNFKQGIISCLLRRNDQKYDTN